MNIRQKQCLLEYLGCYDPENSKSVNNVDGLWGNMSREATRIFKEAYGLPVDDNFDELTEARIKEVVANDEAPQNIWDEIKYFKPEEFQCKCGCGCSVQVHPKLLRLADTVREHFNAPAYVSSGVRCEKHNKTVGGVANSRHLQGKAMDFRIEGNSADKTLSYVLSLSGVRYAYKIDKNYVHMDVV